MLAHSLLVVSTARHHGNLREEHNEAHSSGSGMQKRLSFLAGVGTVPCVGQGKGALPTGGPGLYAKWCVTTVAVGGRHVKPTTKPLLLVV